LSDECIQASQQLTVKFVINTFGLQNRRRSRVRLYVNKAIKKEVNKGNITRVTGRGASGTFRMNEGVTVTATGKNARNCNCTTI